ncbi:uridine kinase family protein [Trueperella bialowiezensis]|uniref:Uridine/cytidine kinase n=1 Tax=Trueperella bialowiezensis TaxID=312285 RepID=A0A3S4WGY6_9ACTO|nr:ATP-binding protein [Trueperella bialowiezensis]VEI13669.1 uridine/cytidine kinase [Trueperella bialowiezensis]
MSTPLSDDGLFDLPHSARRPNARVVLVMGASGSGKTRFTSRTGLPVVSLDDFYYDGDRPGMPTRHGMVDWDSPLTWDKDAAMDALRNLCTTGVATVPVYDIPTSRRIGERTLEMDGRRYVLAEGIFAVEIIDDLRAEGILADALVIKRPRLQTFWFRLMRDLDENRKPLPNLLRRGIAHFRKEPAMYKRLADKGARLVSYSEAQEALTQMLAALRWGE